MTVNTISITPDKLQTALLELWPLKKSVMLWGRPGIGKSAIVKDMAADMNLKLYDLRLTQIDSTDLRGLQYLDNETKRTITYLPDFLPKEGELEEMGYEGAIIFLDEITTAEQRLQACAYQLVLDLAVGHNYKLPHNVWVVAAGNGLDDGAISYDMGTALNDRFIHFNVICDSKQWVKWGEENGIADEVLTFISVRPDYLDAALSAMTEGVESAIKEDDAITPSPRSWEHVSDCRKAGVSQQSMDYIIPGIVGSVAAIAFKTTLDELGSLPPMEELFAASDDELRRILPDKPSGMFGLCYSVPKYCSDAKSFIKAFNMFNILVSIKDGRNRSEVQALAAELLSKRLNTEFATRFAAEVTASKAFQELVKHASEFANISVLDFN